VAFDIKQYQSLKDKGLINKVEKTNEDTPEALTYAVYLKKFEVDGTQLKQLPDEVQSITEKELTDRVDEIDKEKEAIDAFKADAV